MSVYYNEIDEGAADWLEANIRFGLVAPGVVDRRSITEVQPDDLRGFDQHHFFAGIGGWSYAARLAGWPDDRPLWTGSCPCQPFSVAGKGAGVDDARHLWPDLLRLIAARRPAAIVGEQVAGAAGYGWFDGVRAGLAGEGYTGRAVDIPACAIDAPHQRQRLYWLALADTDCSGRDGRQEASQRREVERVAAQRADELTCTALGNADDERSQGQSISRGFAGTAPWWADAERADRGNWRHVKSWWTGADWITCHDGKARRVADASAPLLVDGFPNRVLAWRGLGNAIVPPLAAEVIGALMDVLPAGKFEEAA